MKYLFNDFMFDTEQLTLYKNNAVVSCRHNEARLLALFLSEPERVFSKDDILAQVWNGKVVSEQAVFENISVLRALLGDEAIKTFPKKGYQWQLEVKPFIEAAPAQPVASNEGPSKATVGNGRRLWLLAIPAVAIVCVIAVLLMRPQEQLVRTRVALLPLLIEPANQHSQSIHAELVQPVWDSLNQTDSFSAVAVKDIKDYRDFFHTPQKYLGRLLQQTNGSVVMAAIVGMHDQQVAIRYLLKSKQGGWSASHSANNLPLLLETLDKHLALIVNSGILEIDPADSNLINARLKILHQQEPDDLVVLSALANSESRTGNHSNAILLADALGAKAKLHNDKTREGEAYVIAASAYMAQSLFAEAAAALRKAFEIFTVQQDYRNLALVQQTYSYLAFEQHDYDGFKQALILAMEFAQQANDPLLEMSISAYLSVVANKFGNKDDRQKYLERAESILDQTLQAREHYGLIYFYSGMYAETDPAAEKYYRKVLAILPVDQTWWERDRAREHLTQLFIKQSRWDEALGLYTNVGKLGASEELMVSNIYAARQAWPQAETHALSAFKLANLSGQKYIALDSALALLGVYKATNQPEKMAIYKQFLAKEASNYSYWLRVNREALDRFSIAIPR